MLNEMLKTIRRDTLEQILRCDILPRGHPDSVTGITSSMSLMSTATTVDNLTFTEHLSRLNISESTRKPLYTATFLTNMLDTSVESRGQPGSELDVSDYEESGRVTLGQRTDDSFHHISESDNTSSDDEGWNSDGGTSLL